MSYKISKVEDHKNTRGWLCGQFFPDEDLFKTDQLEVKFSTMLPGETAPKHFHPIGDELLIILDGKMTVTFDGNTHLLTKNDYVFIQAGSVESIDEVIEPVKFIAIRTPSVPNNKTIVDE